MMIFFLFILGLCVGSFLNVVIDRVPKGKSIVWGRSHCDHCKHKLAWYELIPILSYVMQGGKSRCCKKPLSIQYPLVELAAGIGFVLIFSFYQLSTINYVLSLVLFSSLLVIFVSDFKTEIIPTEALIISGISAVLFCLLNFTNLMDVTNFLLSAFFAWFLFWCLWFFSKGKAMGDGDMYIGLVMGLVLGFPRIIVALYAAFLTGAIVGVILILRRKKTLRSHIPFGPFLIWGLVVGLVWGDAIVALWRTFI